MKNILYIYFAFGAMFGTNAWGQTNYVSTSPSASAPGSDNTLVGIGAGNLNMWGGSNLFIGRGAGMQNMAGTKNVFLGASAGSQNSSGQQNAFLGFNSGYNNSSGNNNTFLGSESGYTNGNGYNNIFVGNRSGYFNAGGHHNAFLGSGAGHNNSNGNNNTFVGADAGAGNTIGTENIFIGSLSGSSNDAGVQNTFVGTNSGVSNIGSQNTFLGYQTGKINTTGSNNSFIGYQAGQANTSGIANVFIGNQAGYANSTATGNVFIGNSAGFKNTTGTGNMFLGQQAGYNSTGSYNLFMGNATGSANTSGIGNTAIGDGALLKNTSGSRNTAIGQYAGVNSTGEYNLLLGFASDVTAATPNITNAVAIGPYSQVGQSNSIVLGASNARVGIGTSAPAAKLEVVSGTSGASGLRLTNLGTTASVLNQTKFLTVNSQGDVVLGSINGSARVGVDAETLWQASGDNLQNTNTGGVIIGPGVSKTPNGYRLYVADGVLTEKVKVAVKSTADWSDRVFDKGYQLRSLNEVERYINQEKHLPGVPSAEEVVKEGVDIGKMQAKLLEKVEELTLYVLELKKENDMLKKKSANLEQRINKLQTKNRK